MNSTKVEQHRNKLRNRRIVVIGGFLTFLYMVVGVQAFYLQVIEGDILSKKASKQYQKSMKCQGKRGAIFDANYRELAISTGVVEVGAHPKDIKGKDEKLTPKKRESAM